MRVLITGGRGFLAGHLLDLLQEEPGIVARTVARAECDLAEDIERLCTLLREFRPDRIFHLAGRINGSETEFMRDNHLATRNLSHASQRVVPDAKIVLGSTTAVYGTGGSAGSPLTEENATEAGGSYARSKYAAEQEAETYFRNGGWSATARISNPVGSNMNAVLLCGTLARQVVGIERGGPPVVHLRDLTSSRDFISARDCARALWRISERGTPGNIYNVASGASTPISAIVDMFLASSRVKPIEIQAAAGDADRSAIAEQWLSIVKLRELGWQPEETLRQAIDELVDAERLRA